MVLHTVAWYCCCYICVVLVCEYASYMEYYFLFFFFFKQKTAYEMRISDWSSDVCSSDLPGCRGRRRRRGPHPPAAAELARPVLPGACPWSLASGRPDGRKRRHDNQRLRLRSAARADSAAPDRAARTGSPAAELGRGSRRVRGGQYVEISAVTATLKTTP